MKSPRPAPLLLFVAWLVIPAMIGCSSDDPVSPGPPLIPYIWPETADELMVNFERAYTEMHAVEYENALHEDFKFIFIDSAEVWYRQTDLTSTANMFAGNPGTNPDDTYRAPIQSIAINTLIRQTPWTAVPSDDPDFPDTEKALYQVQIIFVHEGGENTMTVQSDHLFFVMPEEIDQGDGSTRTRYFLAGQRDLAGGGGKGGKSRTWGAVKAIYH